MRTWLIRMVNARLERLNDGYRDIGASDSQTPSKVEVDAATRRDTRNVGGTVTSDTRHAGSGRHGSDRDSTSGDRSQMKSFLNGFLTTLGACAALTLCGIFGLSIVVILTDGGRL